MALSSISNRANNGKNEWGFTKRQQKHCAEHGVYCGVQSSLYQSEPKPFKSALWTPDLDDGVLKRIQLAVPQHHFL